MGTKISLGALGTLALLAFMTFSCGDDDDDGAARCPADAAAGSEVSCSCGGSRTGTATCSAKGDLAKCECSDAGTSSNGGRGGSAGSSGASSGSGGRGGAGSGGSTPAQDSGTPEPEADAGDDEEPMPPSDPMLPMDGNQLAVCDNDRDCNMNLGCYGAGSGGFCTRACEQEQDCADLPGATYHCGGSGLCSVVCENADDDASCPPGLECTQRGGGGDGNGGGGDAFRCLYPEAPAEPEGMPFAQCEGGGSCMDGLQCLGDNMGQPGFCSHACTPQNSDCSDVPAPSGTIAATCVPQTPEQGVCALNCEAMPAGCPAGMQCVEQGFFQLCLYRE
ncbi:MAG TPA: hypothetical protein VK509_04570 [Polyangiales bacterium]|nr:hypothetical protein [Polyangiales bacterium]